MAVEEFGGWVFCCLRSAVPTWQLPGQLAPPAGSHALQHRPSSLACLILWFPISPLVFSSLIQRCYSVWTRVTEKNPRFCALISFPHSHLYDFQTWVCISVVRATFLCFKYFTHPPFRSSLEAHSAFPSAFGTLASQVILHVLSEQPGEGKGSDFPPGPTTQSSYSGTVDVGKAEDPLPSLRKWNLFQHDKNFTCRQKANQEKVNYFLWMTKQMLHRDHEITGREENLYLFRTNVTRRVKSTNVNYFTNRNKNLVLSKYDQTPFSLQISGTFSNWRCNE